MRPAVSVVVPFLNSARYLARAVDSVFRQTSGAWELVLVDGGSSDASRDIAERLARKHPNRVRRVRHRGSRPLGLFQSRVLGARHARAPLVALLDSDDEWDPRYLERRLASFRRGRPGLVYSPVVYFWDDGRRPPALQRTPPPGAYAPGALIQEFLRDGYIRTPAAASAVLPRSVLLSAAPASRNVGRHPFEDMYLWFFVALRHSVRVDGEPLAWYRQHPDSISAKAKHELPRRRRLHLNWFLRHVRNSRLPGRAEIETRVRQALA